MKITRNIKRFNDENQNTTIFTLKMLHFSKGSLNLWKSIARFMMDFTSIQI